MRRGSLGDSGSELRECGTLMVGMLPDLITVMGEPLMGEPGPIRPAP